MYLSLPFEILELIVDALTLEDIKVLSLVCQALLPLCRMRLFETISVLGSRGRNPTAIGLWKLLRGTPELGPCIHTIIYLIDDEPPMDVWTPAISQQLTKLESLHIHFKHFRDSATWNTTPHRLALLSLLHRPTLTHLKLDSLDNFPLSYLIPCVGLKHLEILSVTFGDGPADPLTALPKPIVIDRFTVSEQYSRSLQTLSSAQRADGKPIIDLTTVKTFYMWFAPYQDFQKIISVLGKKQHLVEVELDLSNMRCSLQGLCDILVGSLETLKFLKFHINTWDLEDPMSGLAQQLEKLRYRNVIESIDMKIFLKAVLDSDFDGKYMPGTLDRTLSKGGWPSLKYVSLVLKPRLNSPSKEVLLGLRETHFTGLVSSSTVHFELEVV